MGDTPDQEMLDVKSAGDGELQVGPGVPASRCSPAIGNLGICDAAANQEAPVKDVEMAEDQPPAGLSYTIDDQRSSFTEFIKDLRVILADHQDREDICDRHVDPNISSSRKHPLLPKPRAEQPVRWIRIKLQLQVVEGEESSSSATLLMRDDNVDVIGFINQSGVCYDFADPKRSARRILPQEYKPSPLGLPTETPCTKAEALQRRPTLAPCRDQQSSEEAPVEVDTVDKVRGGGYDIIDGGTSRRRVRTPPLYTRKLNAK
ncbi:unnamed protein product [Miscanthus lutarioriparius]|uniref:rRNA N-glycosylase n=1 Tax=Miscanthus lutarioriparius TaxID=422564 RepID=A0A811QDE8_9POAL|nr:unnamed protein product [Miscanthus lutarioriparius]